ncbi:MAG: S41 family peptidase [Bacteroidales bacterium]
MEETKKSSWLIYAMLLTLGIFLGTKIPQKHTQNTTGRFNSLLEIVQKNYVDTINEEQVENAAIMGMLSSLDPHSVFVPASELKAVNEELQSNFEGIGVQFRAIDDTVTVILPVSGGPSEKVGIKAGDRIVTVNGKSIAGKNLSNEEIIKKLKGPKGTKVKLGILRYGLLKPKEFTVIRDIIPTFSVDVHFMVEPSIGYIKVSKFADNTAEEFANAMAKLNKAGLKNVIIDLRSNGGGYLGAAVEIADMFLEKGDMIVYTQGEHRKRTDIKASGNGKYKQTKVVVLMDEWSASASEIVAGAMQDNDRGSIVGRRSFGKGLVQEQMELNDGSALRLTVARYYTPSGRCIQKPYKAGTKDYEEELLQRYISGEILGTDTHNLHSDTTKYYTQKGRVVYGGGGIQPDVQVPYKTDKNFVYLNQLNQKGLLYQYAFSYADKNREHLKNTYKTANDFTRKFEVSSQMFTDFLAYAEKNEVKKNLESIQKFTPRIKNLLKAYIGRDLFDDIGFYPIYLQTDEDFLKAVETAKK